MKALKKRETRDYSDAAIGYHGRLQWRSLGTKKLPDDNRATTEGLTQTVES
jgi:hypothetical protein